MNSTFSAHNADNMSWKSRFNDGFSLEGPSVERQLPHHADALGGCGVGQITLGALVAQFANANRAVGISHAFILLGWTV
jgi:hypothetical protein